MLLLALIAQLAVGPAARAQDATPAGAAAAAGTLGEMLARVPAELPGLEDPARATVAYADIASQYAAVGLARPERVEAGEPLARFWAATRSMPFPGPAAMYLGSWREDYGFDLLQADQTLWVGPSPYELALFRGRFDAGAVRRALEAAGYRPTEADGHAMLSVRGDYEQDLQAPTAYKLAAMNYAAILDDGTLAFASARAPLAAVLEVAAGRRASLAEQPGVAALVAAAPAELVSALLVHGAQLGVGLQQSPLERTPGAVATERAAAGTMPPVAMALLGTTAGGPLPTDGEPVPLPPGAPDARAVAVLLVDSPEAAEAAAMVVAERLATWSSARFERSWAHLFPERAARAEPGEPVLVVELALAADTPSNIWLILLPSRDLAFLAW
jgi:hypothetical protein